MTRLDDYHSAMLAGLPDVTVSDCERVLDAHNSKFPTFIADHGLGPLWHERTGRPEFRENRAEDLASYGNRFGVVFALDTLHDMPHPDRALAAVRSVLEPDGVMVIQDIKSKPGFENNLRNPVLALQYGYSLTSCLASGLSEADGMGLGTLGFNPEVAERLVRAAGFSRFVMHDLEAPTELFYEVRI